MKYWVCALAILVMAAVPVAAVATAPPQVQGDCFGSALPNPC